MSNFGSLSAEAEHKENDFVDLRGMGCVLKKWRVLCCSSGSRRKRMCFSLGFLDAQLCSMPPDEQQIFNDMQDC